MRSCVYGAIVVGLLVACASQAEAKPNHAGFTGDLGLGLALTFTQSQSVAALSCSTNGCDSSGGSLTETEAEFGYAPLSVSLGGFVSPYVAILGRSSGTAFIRDKNLYSNSFIGPIVEVWPADVFYFSAGPGLALASRNGFFAGTGQDTTAGWGLDLRAGFALLQKQNNDFTVSAELIPSFYRDNGVSTHATGCALVGAWKWY
ncbi:MAG: hypothetical protein ABJB12_24215 [Pseudomonadota bacterium]